MENQNRIWRIRRKPEGEVSSDDFDWVAEPAPQAADGQLLVKTIFLSIDPVSACLAADANLDGIVDITEVQNATNNLLNGP